MFTAPKVFSIAFSVVKNFLNDYTLRKIQIIKNDPNKWKPVLLNVIDVDQLPAHFGGTLTDPDGNPRYTTKVSITCNDRKLISHDENLSFNLTFSDTYIITVISRKK